MSSNVPLASLGIFEPLFTVVGILTVGRILLQALWAIGNGLRAHIFSRLWQRRLAEDYGRWAGG